MKYDILDPFEEMKDLRKQMDKMMEDFWSKRKSLMKSTDIKEPSVDVEEKKDELKITADLPGVDKKDIEVHADKDRIEIKAKKKKESEVKKKDFYKHERASSGYYRAFSLPATVNPDRAKCSFKDGILNVTLPKVKELPKKSKKIVVK